MTITKQITTTSAFRSIIHQVFTEDVTLVKHAMRQFQLKGRKYADEFISLWDILVAITANDLQRRNIICVLDGLDESEKVDRVQMIELLETLQQPHAIVWRLNVLLEFLDHQPAWCGG